MLDLLRESGMGRAVCFEEKQPNKFNGWIPNGFDFLKKRGKISHKRSADFYQNE